MVVIKEKRGGGKTTSLVKLLQKDAANLLLVFSEGERSGIIRHFQLEQNQVLSWNYYIAHPEFWSRPLLIDNVDMFLRERLKSDIFAVSINED